MMSTIVSLLRRRRGTAALITGLGVSACGGRSQQGAEAAGASAAAGAGASGTAGAHGGAAGSGSTPSVDEPPGAGHHGGGAVGAAASGGSGEAGSATPNDGGAGEGGSATPNGGSAGELTHWTLPHTSNKPWRQSTEPLCVPRGNGLPWDLWSDERGLYVLSDDGTAGRSLHFNDGSGWSALRLAQPDSFGLTGIRGGPLVLYWGNPCGVVFQDGASDVCASALPSISNVFVASPSRTFAIAVNHVLRYDGESFTQYGKLLPYDSPTRPYRLWADDEVVIAATDQGHVYILPDTDSAATVLTLPGSAPVYSLWAFGRDDIWVGLDGQKLAHYDGSSWNLVPFGDLACGAVTALWGNDHVLFFAGQTFIGKIENGVPEVFFAASACPDQSVAGSSEEVSFQKIWGNSAREVFFAATERRIDLVEHDGSLDTVVTDPDACGMQRLYWYDGTRVRPL